MPAPVKAMSLSPNPVLCRDDNCDLGWRQLGSSQVPELRATARQLDCKKNVSLLLPEKSLTDQFPWQGTGQN